MRRRTLACITATVAALAAATASATAAAPVPSSAGPCAHASALYEAGYYADAEKAYKRLLGVAPCATSRDVELAQAAGATTAADLIAQARAARDAGFEARSRELVQQLVTDHPDASVPNDLRAPDQRLGFWQGFLASVGPPLLFAAEALAAGLALFIAVRLLWLALLVLLSWRQPKLLVSPFVGMDVTDAGDGAMSALHEHLRRLQRPRAGRSLFFADPAEPAFAALPDAIASAFPQAGLIAALVTFLGQLVPGTQWRVAGTLRPVDAWRGAGLTVVLTKEHGSETGEVTVWESDYHLIPDGQPDADALAGRYQRLALPAAVWLAYCRELGFDRDAPPAGTADWRSYARFAVGEDAQEFGDDALADRLYRDALDLDPANLGARVNLAALLLSPPGQEESPAACVERTQLRDDLLGVAAVALGDDTDDPLWYRVHYLTAISRLYAGAPSHDDARLRSAADEARRLADAIGRSCPESTLAPLLDRMRFPVEVLRANIEVERRGADVDAPDLTGRWIGAAGHYNLACHFARKLRKLREVPAGGQRWDDEARARARALSHLRSALVYGDAETRLCAKTDPALEVLCGYAEFERLVAEPAAPAAPSDGALHATLLHGTLLSVSSSDGSDGAGDGR